MARCRVVFDDHEIEVPVEDEDASIQALVAKARAQLEAQGRAGEMPPTSQLVIHRGRDAKELCLADCVKGLVQNGDLLFVEQRLVKLDSRRRIATGSQRTEPPSEQALLRAQSPVKTTHLDKQSSQDRLSTLADENKNIPPGLPGCRLGVFSVTPLQAENPPQTSHFRLLRLSIAIRLLPYDDVHTTAIAAGPNYAWSLPMRFTHFDPTRSGLILQLTVCDEPFVGSRAVVGRAYVAIEDALDCPGTPLRRWTHMDPVSNGVVTSTIANGSTTSSRLLVSICFHPKVSKGPTVQALLHSMTQANGDTLSPGVGKFLRHGKPSRVRTLLNKLWRNNEIRAVEAKTLLKSPGSQRQLKGSLTFELREIHLCGDHCTKLDGHSAVSLPHFSPTVVVGFDDFEEEICMTAGDCNTTECTHEWPVYSSYSKVDVVIYKKATLGAGSTFRRHMADGSLAVPVGSLTISCFDIQEQAAVKWTRDLLEPLCGPGKRPPPDGYEWYPLILDDDQVGLALIAAQYSENLLALVGSEESADLVFVRPEERDFDAAIVQRNFERLDELYLSLQEIKSYGDDILDLKYPMCSLLMWISINGFFFIFSAEHFPLLCTFVILGTLSMTWVGFLRGATHKKWIEYNPTSSRLKMYRPIATLRFVPVRARHLLPVVGQDDHPDSFVRVYYEPNYKKVPIQQIAVTECARRTQNPVWSNPQRGSIRDDFLSRNNNRVKDLVRHLSVHAQAAVLHDVVEPWPRKNGIVDANAFRLSMLQPVTVDEITGDEALIGWKNSPGSIRFDVLQDCHSDLNTLLGRVRVPIHSLITNESSGGKQDEVELTLPLSLPSRHSSHSTTSDHSNKPTTTISVRMQMTLRKPDDRITLRDILASEALYEALEMEVERELSWVAKYHKAKDVAKNFQQTLGMVCSTLERLKNLFLWVHPMKTLAVFMLALVGSVCCYFVPMRYLVLFSTTKAFTRKYHKDGDRDLVRFRNLLASIPSDLDMKSIYRWRNHEYLKTKDFSEAHARLQAQWSGVVMRQGHVWLQSWQDRYCAIRGSRLELWHVRSTSTQHDEHPRLHGDV